MSNFNENDIKGLLKQAGSIRPSSEVTQQAMARAREAILQPGRPAARRTKWRTFMRISIPAAAAAMLVAAMVLFYAEGRGRSAAFADVVKMIESASTMSFIETVDMDKDSKYIARFYVASAGKMRQDLLDDHGTVTQVEVTNPSKGYHMTLLIRPKRALLTRVTPQGATTAPGKDMGMNVIPGYADATGKFVEPTGPQPPMLSTSEDFVDQLKKMAAKSHADLGTKMMGQQRVVGFRLGEEGSVMDIWADAATGKPVEIVKQIRRMDGQPGKAVLTDFVFDKDFEEALFDIEPPAGYKVHENASMWSPTSEANLVQALKYLAQFNGGILPDEPNLGLTISEAYMALDEDKRWQVGDDIMLMHYFLQTLPPGSTYKYIGGGKRLGDASKQLLWYAKPGEATCRVVFGDLSIKDVSPDKVERYQAPASQPIKEDGESGAFHMSGLTSGIFTTVSGQCVSSCAATTRAKASGPSSQPGL